VIALRSDEPLAVALIQAVRSGDVDSLRELLDANPELASARIQDSRGCSRTPLHVATDWPGYFPSAPAVVCLLLDAGADPDAPLTGGRHAETPLHWAASSDDVDVAETLIDAGANLEAPGGSIAGTPLSNAVAFGCWHVARLLVARGARIETLWQAAALGATERVEEFLAASAPPTADEINEAFWQACHGGQRRTADYLLTRGADMNASPGYAKETPLDIAGALDTRKDSMVRWLRDLGARSAEG
jgi:ankyrin repeat protein